MTNNTTETKKCKCCGRELPVEAFRKYRDTITDTCRECFVSSLKRGQRAKKMEANIPADQRYPEFAGKTPQEVLSMMRRGKEWLEAHPGYHVTLSGWHEQLVRRDLKFN